MNGNRDMISVSVAPGPELSDGTVLFHLNDLLYLKATENYTPFDVAADGRFIMARRIVTRAAAAQPLIVAENWFQELEARMRR